VKLFVAHRIPLSRTREMIASYRDGAEAERQVLEEIIRVLETEPKAAFPRATALLGLRMCEAVVRWAEEVQDVLPARRFYVDPLSERSGRARELFLASKPPPRKPKTKGKRTGKDR
ncbi:MAG: hypothetical protein ACRDKS_07875, partial [Actinomycetota bacterium]